MAQYCVANSNELGLCAWEAKITRASIKGVAHLRNSFARLELLISTKNPCPTATYPHTHIHALTRTHARTRIHTHTHTHKHTHTHT